MSLSDEETVFLGTLAIKATTSSMSISEILDVLFFKRFRDPASSITSIALSGRFLSFIYLLDNSAAVFKALSEYLIP